MSLATAMTRSMVRDRRARYIQREVETTIGRALIAGDIAERETMVIDADGDEQVVRRQDRESADEPSEAVEAAV